MHRRSRRLALLVTAAFLALGIAWAGANPPAASPDEAAHLVKAYATGTGQLRGQPYRSDTPVENERSQAWFRDSGRTFLLPQRVAPPLSVTCYAFDRDETADCQRFPASADPDSKVPVATHVGTYNPSLYAPAGIAIRSAPDFRAATWRARLVYVALSTVFVAWAAALLRRRGDGVLPIVGLALAITPMVVFLSASVTTNGVETASAICLWAALLRLARRPNDDRGAPWAAAAISGGTLALSRPLGAALLIAVLVIWGFLLGREGARSLMTAGRGRAYAVGGVFAGALVASAGWSAVEMPHPPLDLGLAARSLGPAIRDLPNQARQLIGIFGWNDTTMPLAAYLVALAVIGFVGVLGFVRGEAKERRALVALVSLVLLANVGIATVIEAQIGFGMQARYILPLAVGLPLIACDVLARRGSSAAREYGWIAVMGFGSAAALHLTAFVSNAHRYAVGRSGRWLPPWGAPWNPDGGLGIWLLFALVGSLALVGAAVIARPHQRAELIDVPAD